MFEGFIEKEGNAGIESQDERRGVAGPETL